MSDLTKSYLDWWDYCLEMSVGYGNAVLNSMQQILEMGFNVYAMQMDAMSQQTKLASSPLISMQEVKKNWNPFLQRTALAGGYPQSLLQLQANLANTFAQQFGQLSANSMNLFDQVLSPRTDAVSKMLREVIDVTVPTKMPAVAVVDPEPAPVAPSQEKPKATSRRATPTRVK